MAVALEHEFAALPHADARPGVHSFSRAWVAALVASDVVLFLAATYLAGLFVRHFWLASLPIRHVAVPATLTAALSVLVFWQLGLYRRSFAMSVRDEFYHAVAALSLASAPVLVVFSMFPLVSTSRLVALFASDPQVIADGVLYLRVIAFAQIGQSFELILEGALAGAGYTFWPQIVSTTLTALRIPLAAWWSRALGLVGIWLALSVTAISRGIAMSLFWKSGRWRTVNV